MAFLVGPPGLLGITLTVGVALATAACVYGVVHLCIRGPLSRQEGEARELTVRLGENVFRMSATLMALILSFSFNGLRNDFIALRDAVQLEAAETLDIALDLESLGGEEAMALRGRVNEYLERVIGHEWEFLAERKGLDPEASRIFSELQLGFHPLEANTPAETSLRGNLITDIDEISD